MKKEKPAETADRKNSHLAICLEEEVDFHSNDSTGFGAYRFEHDALPEVDFSKISLETEILGKKLSAPIIIGAMTGGTERTGEINRRLALAAERCQVGMALGSQRKMLEDDLDSGQDSGTLSSYHVRKSAPGIPLLFGNLGAVQLNYGATAPKIRQLIARVGCDAFNFHLNPLQEAIQPEGDRDFSGLHAKLQECIPQLGVPVFIKEVGAGISAHTARKLKTLPIAGVETAGAGGTSWAKIEGLRSENPMDRSLGSLFAQWGVPTARSLLCCRAELPELQVICSGGMRDGIEIAKAMALGADAVALALPILKAAEKSVDHAVQAIEKLCAELRTVMFVTGMRSIQDLKERGRDLLHDDSGIQSR